MSSLSLPVDLQVQFIGYWLETLVYGIYLTTCVSCARALLRIQTGPEVRWRTRKEIKWFFVVVASLLFTVSTLDIVVGLLRTMQLFVVVNSDQNGLADSSNVSSWITIARFVTQMIQLLLGDLVLVYRCLIVYGHCWKLAVPSVLLYVTDVAVAVAFISDKNTLRALGFRGSTSYSNPPPLWALWVTFFGIAAIQNILTTWLLIQRIWNIDRQGRKLAGNLQPAPQRSLRNVIRILAECGVCYTTMIVATFVVSLFNSKNAIYPVSDVTLQAAGIAFNFIIMQTGPTHGSKAVPIQDGAQMSSLRFHVASTTE
ncbi:hypothetical protein R3P38DRAFT_804304 [Favolaschia claudopus]|uniref:Uncharacterized protein n=1 Tax=Favolaschia claudopus TaxID=2862362 RepID=A0AAV9Z2D5_9AGAR